MIYSSWYLTFARVAEPEARLLAPGASAGAGLYRRQRDPVSLPTPTTQTEGMT